MQILFNEKEMEKNIEFTKKVFEMTNLDGYHIFFDKFLENKWKRYTDPKMNLERFIIRMKNSNFFVSKLWIGEDDYIPIRYAVNARVSYKEDSLLEIHCDLTGRNYSKLHKTYKEIYNRDFFSSI